MPSQISYEAPNWTKIYRMLLRQAEKIRISGFKPEVIVGVSRGGWIPARILSDMLGVLNLANMKIEHYKGIGEKAEAALLTQNLSVDVTGKRVLLVDDVADSGESLQIGAGHIHDRGSKELKVATLYCKPMSAFKPDFYGEETAYWVVFPWEIKETVRKIWEKGKANPMAMELELHKLAVAGVPKRLINRFKKELSEGKPC